MKNSPNLLTYIKDKYYEKIEEKVTEYLHNNREVKFKIQKKDKDYSIKTEPIHFKKFEASINRNDFIDATITISILAKVKYNKKAKSKTYNFPVTLYLNCLLRIDNNVIYFNLKRIQD